MVDGTTLIKSSYDDVNNALESLIGNISSGASSAGYRLLNKQIFYTPGQYTYTPTAGTKKVIVKLMGGGRSRKCFWPDREFRKHLRQAFPAVDCGAWRLRRVLR